MMGASKLEVLLAVAASEFHQKTHVLFMPPGKEFVSMLRFMRSSKCIEPMSENFYKLTRKGWQYVNAHKKSELSAIDKEIDAFVDRLK